MTLSQKTLDERLVYPCRYFDSVDSTNDIAMQWLQEGAVSGSVVIADEQRQGKGRKGRTWYTPPKVALAMSVILKPSPENANRISMIGAVAVYDLCESVGAKNIGIKWPNDVQINGKKVSGILPEAAWDTGKLLGVVLGLGVNVRVKFEGELAQTATSLENEIEQSLDRIELLVTLMNRIDYWMARINNPELFDIWKSRLNTIGQQVEVDGIVGQAQGVDEGGALLITVADGSIKRVLAGDVSLLPPQNEG
ncbi:MAG: biotin--[acetyl-CoA-carboxylase] ligase [Anaerolineae bacterium]|nr:biotin--[acetyl-CoA-carboxylase] ligase [Anaerolineae bacterium]MDQ7035908.1 biotin--[acetyl-CoA-carboxylase] ligase [Anaerolineae bacterium]